MKVNEATILIIPGRGNSGAEHWQSRWQQKLSRALRVEQDEWDHPKRFAFVHSVVKAIEGAPKPVIVVAHSLGVTATLWAQLQLPKGLITGGFFVTPPSDDYISFSKDIDSTFAPTPRHKLTFPTLLIASRNDHTAPFEWSQTLASAIGAEFLDAGEAGHMNIDSGYGPWPEGLLRFAGFLKTL